VRAFNSNARVRAAHAALLAYVQAGGTLVVQYNTNNRLIPLNTPIGPFPFEIGQERVTDENAPVTFILPAHSILNYPNKISRARFRRLAARARALLCIHLGCALSNRGVHE
jgi:hypothetical protein